MIRKLLHTSLVLLAILSACSAGKASAGKGKKNKIESELSEKQLIQLKSSFFEANREKMLGNFELAQTQFEACLKIYPNHAPSIYEIALIKQKMSQMLEAQELLEKAVELNPNNKWYIEVLAQVYEENREFEKAASTYNSLIEKYPKQGMYYEAMANTHLMNNDAKSALKVYKLMEDVFGVAETSSMQMQKIYLVAGKTDKAIEEAKKLIDVAPGTAKYYNNLAEIYYKSGDKEKAMQTYEKLLKIDPDNAFVQLSMATYYYDGGEVEKAKDVMRSAYSNKSLDFESKARILFKNVAYENVPRGSVNPFAFELIDLMKVAHADNAKVYAIEGDLLYQSKKIIEANEAYHKSVGLDENQFLVWSQMLLLESELNNWELIFEDASKAIQLFPSQGTFYYFKGVAALQLSNPEDAVEALLAGVDLVVDNPNLKSQFYTNLGDALHQLKRHEESDENFEKALAMNPNDMLVLNNYSYYLSIRGEKLDKAEKMSRKTVDNDPESNTYLDTYAWILYVKGDYEGAKKWMQFALNNGGDKEAVIVEHFGDILYKLGEKDAALIEWIKADKLGEGSEFLKKKIETKELYE